MKEYTQEEKREALENLQQQNGLLNPQDVVEDARSENSVLHEEFEWDDGIAAEKHRLHQARQLINVMVTVIPQDKKGQEVKAFVSLTNDRHKKGGYRAMVDVLNDEDLRAQLLEDAYRDLQILQDKYSTLKELRDVFDSIKKVLLTPVK